MQEIDLLNKRIVDETPPEGVLYYKFSEDKKEDDEEWKNINGKNSSQIANRKVEQTSDKKLIKIRFSDLAISKATIGGLFKAKYIKMTETQRAVIPHAIANRDMVICARTGSGKTLCYLIPVIEKLYRERWTSLDGLGALVLVPTRELAIQAFEVLRSFANYHEISAGLIIGGKDVEKEKDMIRSMNILICTPGRLL